MAERTDMPVANVRDLPAFAGILLAATALAMPWYRERACPIFEECGPWRDVSGWETFGFVALAGLFLALSLSVVVRDPVLRRLLPAICCILLGGALAFVNHWATFVLFGDRVGPLAGFWVFAGGLATAAVGWLVAAASVPSRATGA